MMENPAEIAVKQVEQIAELFGSQAELAKALGLSRKNVTEWKARGYGIPPKHYRRLFYAAQERQLELPEWFPRFQDTAA